MMNFQDRIQTNAPSIRYEGDLYVLSKLESCNNKLKLCSKCNHKVECQQGRMPPMAMGGAITGPTIQGPKVELQD